MAAPQQQAGTLGQRLRMVEPRSYPQSRRPPSSSHSKPNSNEARPASVDSVSTTVSDKNTITINGNLPSPQPSPFLLYGADGSSDDRSGKDNVSHSDWRNAATIASASSLRSIYFNHRVPKRRSVLHRHQASPSRIEPIGRHRRSGIPSDIADRISLRDLSATSLATAHYTISQDHTGGEESRRSHLFAGFGRKHQRHPATRGAAVSQSNTSPAITMESLDPLSDSSTLELANPLNTGDVLADFDFDSFLHDQDGDNSAFNFAEAFPMGDEIE